MAQAVLAPALTSIPAVWLVDLDGSGRFQRRWQARPRGYPFAPAHPFTTAIFRSCCATAREPAHRYQLGWSVGGHWKSNGADIYGSNSGTLQNSPAFVAGNVGQAMSVNGTNGISVPTSSSLNFGVGANFSIDAWIRTDNTDRNTLTIVDKRLLSGSNVTGYALYLYNGQVGISNWPTELLLDIQGLSADLRDGTGIISPSRLFVILLREVALTWTGLCLPHSTRR